MTKSRLLPATVPWRVDLTDPRLEIHPMEGREPPSVQVTFLGAFCGPSSSANQLDAREEPIKITFDDVLAFWKLSHLDAAGFLREFGWDSIGGGADPLVGSMEDVTRGLAQWIKTGFCPDPYFYEIQPPLPEPSSKSLGEVVDVTRIDYLNEARRAFKTGQRHYLLMGEDEFVEVVAARWRWESVSFQEPVA